MTENSIKHIYTVSKLTKEIKTLLEETFPFIWVTGEISNYAVPSSGHSYFTLKDQQAIVSAVMFKNQKRNLKFELENGINIVGLARLSLYEPRGSYQLIFEHVEPEGAGAMQIAFEQLKKKLMDKGFFDHQHKIPIPFLPSTISVISSGTGAAVKDIINIAKRRFPNCCLEIFPVKVQGNESEHEICNAISLVNNQFQSDVIILARGGGSLEDLAPFNSEKVAHAIFNSHIPIITGIGHEIDFTIADFVADLRAPTPSAAAELALPDKTILLDRINECEQRLGISLKKKIQTLVQTVRDFTARLKSPRASIYDLRLKLDEFETRLFNRISHYLQYNTEKWLWLTQALYTKTPEKKIATHQQNVNSLFQALTHAFQNKIQDYSAIYHKLDSKLQTMNPHAVLKRGYSMTRFAADKKLIRNTTDVKVNDQIEVLFSKGNLITRVEKING